MCEVNLNGWTTAMPTTEAKGASKVTTATATTTTTKPTKTDKITAVKIEAVPTRTLDKPYNGTIKIANKSQVAGRKRKRAQEEIQRLEGGKGDTGEVKSSDEFPENPNQILIGQQEEGKQQQQQQQQQQQPNMTGLRRRGRPHKSSAQVQLQRNQSNQLAHNSNSICNNNNNIHLTTQAIGQAQLEQYQNQFHQFQQSQPQQQQHRANFSHPEPMNLSSSNNKRSLFTISKQVVSPINNKTGNKNNSCYDNPIEAFKVAASLIQNTANSSTHHCNGFQTTTQTQLSSGLHNNNKDNQRLEQIASSFHPVPSTTATAAYIFPSQASTFQQTAPYGELFVNKVSQSSGCVATTLPARSKSSLSLPPSISGCYIGEPATNSNCLISQQSSTRTTMTTRAFDKHNGFLNDTRAASCGDMIAHHEALQRSFANLHNLSAVASVLQQSQQGGPQLHHLQNLAYIHRNVATTAAGSSNSLEQHQTTTAAAAAAAHLGNAQPIKPATSKKSLVRKCRKVYGMERRYAWCIQCKWKKACSRFCDRRVQAAAVAAAAVAAATSLVTGRADHHGSSGGGGGGGCIKL